MSDKQNINFRKQKLTVYILLILVTAGVFWQVNRFDFVNIDDNVYVTENNFVRSGITPDGLRWMFSTTYGEFWHPLTWLSLMLDGQFHGFNAAGFHLTNLILHILSTLLLFWFLNRSTCAVWKSAFVAAFFALHPLHVESVAWIAERKDVLSAFFWMLTLCLYVLYIEKPVVKRYLLVLLCFACGLMSKSMVVTLPVVMLLLDYWPLKRFRVKKTENDLTGVASGKGFLWLLWEKTPFFVLSAFFSMGTFLAQQNPTARKFTWGSRIANAPVSFLTYLEKTFWPHDLAVFYPLSDQLPIWQVLGAVLLILVISAAVIAAAKRLPYLFVGWFWYTVTLLPVIGIIQVGKQSMADRYTYLPLIGIGIGLAWSAPLLFRRENTRKRILFPLVAVFICILSFVTWKQCGYWKNSIELFHHALRVTQNNYLAHNDLGLALFNEGKTEEAIDHYDKAIRIMPDHMIIYNNRGDAYTKLGLYQRAIEDFSEAIRLKPDYADFYSKRGAVYLNQGNYGLGCRDAFKACELGDCAILDAAQAKRDCR
jgi:protein O-mannosyl-transferase